VIAESEELIKKLNRRSGGKGMKVNMNKTTFMINGESRKGIQNTGRWPCGACGRGIGRKSIQRTVRNG